jgi:ankyrin repeat protein
MMSGAAERMEELLLRRMIKNSDVHEMQHISGKWGNNPPISDKSKSAKRLISAIKDSRLVDIKRLLIRGCAINSVDSTGRSTLFWAARGGRIAASNESGNQMACLRLLLQAVPKRNMGEFIEMKTHRKTTALMCASAEGRLHTVIITCAFLENVLFARTFPFIVKIHNIGTITCGGWRGYSSERHNWAYSNRFLTKALPSVGDFFFAWVSANRTAQKRP